MNHTNPPEPKTTVIHDVPPESTEAKILYDVFSWGRESTGEYFYYGEIDSNAVKPDGTGDLTNANVFLEVNVSFEDDFRAYVSDDLHGVTSGEYPKLDLDNAFGREDFMALTPSQVYSHIDNPDELSVIEYGPNWYTSFQLNSYSKSVAFVSRKIDGMRVTEITVCATNDAATIEWMHNRFSELCRKYSDIPMNVFSGAPRD